MLRPTVGSCGRWGGKGAPVASSDARSGLCSAFQAHSTLDLPALSRPSSRRRTSVFLNRYSNSP